MTDGPPSASQDAHSHRETSPKIDATNASPLPLPSRSEALKVQYMKRNEMKVDPRASNASVESPASGWTTLNVAAIKVACSALSLLTAPWARAIEAFLLVILPHLGSY